MTRFKQNARANKIKPRFIEPKQKKRKINDAISASFYEPGQT